MELAGFMTFETHEKLRLKLLAALTRDPPDSRYAPLSLEHIRNADRETFRLLSKALRTGVRPASPMDPLPSTNALNDVLKSVEFNLFLLPLPVATPQRKGEKRESDEDSGPPSKRSRAQRRNNQLAQLKNQVETLKQNQHSSPPPREGVRGAKVQGEGEAQEARQCLSNWLAVLLHCLMALACALVLIWATARMHRRENLARRASIYVRRKDAMPSIRR